MPPRRPTTSPHAALYVRLPADEARKLDRAAHAVGAPKKDLVAGLVARYVDPDTDRGLAALRRLGAEAPGALPRRGVVEGAAPPPVRRRARRSAARRRPPFVPPGRSARRPHARAGRPAAPGRRGRRPRA